MAAIISITQCNAPSQTLSKKRSGWRRLVRERCVGGFRWRWAVGLVVVRYLQWTYDVWCGEKKQGTFLLPSRRVSGDHFSCTTPMATPFHDITKKAGFAKSGKGSAIAIAVLMAWHIDVLIANDSVQISLQKKAMATFEEVDCAGVGVDGDGHAYAGWA